MIQIEYPPEKNNIILLPAALPCAWCMAERGEQAKEESHGICTYHDGELREKSKARQARRGQRS